MAKFGIKKDQMDRVENSIQRSYDVDELLNRGELAGFDMKALRKKNADDRKQLLQIQQAFKGAVIPD